MLRLWQIDKRLSGLLDFQRLQGWLNEDRDIRRQPLSNRLEILAELTVKPMEMLAVARFVCVEIDR